MTAARQIDWEHHLEVPDMIAELTAAHQHRERYEIHKRGTMWGRTHRTRVPSLLTQLEHAAPSGQGDDRGGGYESRPAARIEALDVLTWIDNASARWLRQLGQDDPGSTVACLRLLASLHPSATGCSRRHPGRGTCCTRHAIEADVRRWWTQARIVTGWDSPAWRPDATCPLCGVRGGLRIRLADRVGMCVKCRESWDPGDYQQLADHVRREAEERRRSPVEVVEVQPGQNRGW